MLKLGSVLDGWRPKPGPGADPPAVHGFDAAAAEAELSLIDEMSVLDLVQRALGGTDA